MFYVIYNELLKMYLDEAGEWNTFANAEHHSKPYNIELSASSRWVGPVNEEGEK